MFNPTQDGVIWLDGQWIEAPNARVHVMTHTLHYGFGVFEGLRAYKTKEGTAIFRLHAHTDRLFRSAKMLGIELPYTKSELNAAQCQIIAKNKLEEAYLRPMCFHGDNTLGLRVKKDTTVHVMIASWEWKAYFANAEDLENGIRVKMSSYTRHHVNSTLTKAKANGNYINSILATQEAAQCGYDEALMLDLDGYLAEASSANVFLVRDGIIYTPPTDACLEGITRDSVLHIARDEGFTVIEKRITRDEIYTADEAFLTGSAVEIMAIREVDGRVLGHGTRGPVTGRLAKAFFDEVHGRREGYPDWLTLI